MSLQVQNFQLFHCVGWIIYVSDKIVQYFFYGYIMKFDIICKYNVVSFFMFYRKLNWCITNFTNKIYGTKKKIRSTIVYIWKM